MSSTDIARQRVIATASDEACDLYLLRAPATTATATTRTTMADNLHRLPEEVVPEGWRVSFFDAEWCRMIGPPLDVPTRIGETRALLQVRRIEPPLRPWPEPVFTTSNGPVALTVDVGFADPESLASACARAERAFCGCRVRRPVAGVPALHLGEGLGEHRDSDTALNHGFRRT